MDITYASEWNAKRYERVIDASLRVTGPFRTSFFGWCMTVCGLIWLCSAWMRCGRLEGWNWALLVVSNAYGYYCKGMNIGRVEVVVTADRSVKIIDKHSRED